MSDTANTEPKAYDKTLANKVVIALETGRGAYAAADSLVAKLHSRLPPGTRIPLRDGRVLELVDNFADGKNVAYKPSGIKRLDAKVHDNKRGRSKSQPKAKAKPKAKPKAKTKSKS